MRCIAICAAISQSHVLTATPAQNADAPSNAPTVITLPQAIDRARGNDPNVAAAGADAKATALDRSISHAALLPNAVYHNQYLFTQGTGGKGTVLAGSTQTSAPIFIANNAVHEYTSQAAVTETMGLKSVADVRLADATAARAAAEYEIARRGLVATVVVLYYNLTASEHKVAVAQRASNEAAGFTDLTSKRENVGAATRHFLSHLLHSDPHPFFAATPVTLTQRSSIGQTLFCFFDVPPRTLTFKAFSFMQIAQLAKHATGAHFPRAIRLIGPQP